MPRKKLPPIGDVITLYRSGLSSGEIAEQFGASKCTVVGALRRAGEPRRSCTEAQRLAVISGRHTPPRFWLGKTQPPEMVANRAAKTTGHGNGRFKDGSHARGYRSVVSKKVCEACGATDRLIIHHRNDNHFDNNKENLQVLCTGCHQSLHKTAYWAAKRAGRPIPKSNGPVGWRRP